VSEVPFEDIHPNPEQLDPPETHDGPEHSLPADYRREQLRQMTRDAEPYADRVDVFGPPRTKPPSPAEAHEIMQRVTGNPKGGQYMGAAELSARYAEGMRQALAGARLPVPPFPGVAEALRARLRERPLFPPPMFVAGEETQAMLDDAIKQHVAAEARRTESSMSASLASMDLAAADAVVLDLRTNGDVPVTVTVLMEQRHFDQFPELTSLVGEAMQALTDAVRVAVLTMRSLVDENGERTAPARQANASAVRRTTLVTCGHCGRDLFEQRADGSAAELYVPDWQWERGEAVCKSGDREGCQP
jgi:hypothetical protein